MGVETAIGLITAVAGAYQQKKAASAAKDQQKDDQQKQLQAEQSAKKKAAIDLANQDASRRQAISRSSLLTTKPVSDVGSGGLLNYGKATTGS